MPVPGQSGDTNHFRFIQNQQHEKFIGNIPFALDSMLAAGSESKSGIVIRVSYNKNEWAPRVLEFAIARFDQFTSNSLVLVCWKHSHRAKRRTSNIASDNCRAVHDVTDDSSIHCRNQGKQRRSVGSQCVDDVAFLILAKCAPVQITNSRHIIRTFFSNFDHTIESRSLATGFATSPFSDIPPMVNPPAVSHRDASLFSSNHSRCSGSHATLITVLM